MNGIDAWLAIIIVFVLGVFAGCLAMDKYGVKIKTSRAAIEQCEEQLPRDQKCILIAVEESK